MTFTSPYSNIKSLSLTQALLCICRNINRNTTDLEPHRFQFKDNPFFTLCISELLCRKSRLTVSMSVVGCCLPVLPDYHAHRGLLSSGLWNKCERPGRTPRRVPNKVQCGSGADIYTFVCIRLSFQKSHCINIFSLF